MSVLNLCNTTALVQYVTKTRDSIGGWTESWATRYSAMPCRLQQTRIVEQATAGAVRVIQKPILFVPPGYESLSENDRVTIGGNVYQINGVNNVDGMNHHLEVDMRRLKEAI